MNRELVVGEKQRFEARFYLGDPDDDGVLADPTSIKFIFRKPSDVAPTILVWPGDDIDRDEAGVFRVDLEYTEAGVWYWRYESTGAVIAADQGKVIVKAERPVG